MNKGRVSIAAASFEQAARSFAACLFEQHLIFRRQDGNLAMPPVPVFEPVFFKKIDNLARRTDGQYGRSEIDSRKNGTGKHAGSGFFCYSLGRSNFRSDSDDY